MSRQTKRGVRTLVLTKKGHAAVGQYAQPHDGVIPVPLLDLPMRDDRRDLRTGDGR